MPQQSTGRVEVGDGAESLIPNHESVWRKVLEVFGPLELAGAATLASDELGKAPRRLEEHEPRRLVGKQGHPPVRQASVPRKTPNQMSGIGGGNLASGPVVAQDDDRFGVDRPEAVGRPLGGVVLYDLDVRRISYREAIG